MTDGVISVLFCSLTLLLLVLLSLLMRYIVLALGKYVMERRQQGVVFVKNRFLSPYIISVWIVCLTISMSVVVSFPTRDSGL